MSKEKKRDPIKVMLRVTIVLAVVAVAALLLGNAIIGYRANLLKARQEEAEEINNQKAEEYAVAWLSLRLPARAVPTWPGPSKSRRAGTWWT